MQYYVNTGGKRRKGEFSIMEKYVALEKVKAAELTRLQSSAYWATHCVSLTGVLSPKIAHVTYAKIIMIMQNLYLIIWLELSPQNLILKSGSHNGRAGRPLRKRVGPADWALQKEWINRWAL